MTERDRMLALIDRLERRLMDCNRLNYCSDIIREMKAELGGNSPVGAYDSLKKPETGTSEK